MIGMSVSWIAAFIVPVRNLLPRLAGIFRAMQVNTSANYVIRIDGGYNNQVANPYTADTGAGAATLNQGVIAWSAGSDAKSPGFNSGTTTFSASDDVISWQ